MTTHVWKCWADDFHRAITIEAISADAAEMRAAIYFRCKAIDVICRYRKTIHRSSSAKGTPTRSTPARRG